MNNQRNSLGDEELKKRGNHYYSCKKYDEAIKCYTEAISLNPTLVACYTNRALCYVKLERWSAVRDDGKRALDIDRSNVKAHFYLGSALYHLGCFNEAVDCLVKAHELAKEQSCDYGDEIANLIRKAKKMKWTTEEKKRIRDESELELYINRLILEDHQRQIERIKEEMNGVVNEDCAKQISSVQGQCDKYMDQVSSVFTQIEHKRKTRDIPDYLCGKISFELLQEPVITPSGITYDRKDLMEHLKKIGPFDPVTRKPLTADQLIPNYAMKEVVDAFVQENEWALYC